jgi:hypothetical protein
VTEGPLPQLSDANSTGAFLARLEDGVWVLAAFVHLVGSGALSRGGFSAGSAEDDAAARALAAAGLMVDGAAGLQPAVGLAQLLGDETFVARRGAIVSSLHQLASAVGIVAAGEGDGWATQDDAALLAQGRSSAAGGRLLATVGVATLTGLGELSAAGGISSTSAWVSPNWPRRSARRCRIRA